MELLSQPSSKEKTLLDSFCISKCCTLMYCSIPILCRDEILELLSQPTAKEKTLMDTFRSQSGGGVKEFCSHSTKEECMRESGRKKPCEKLHFVKILQPHTDESLGDCSFLNTCFHMDICKYIHYKVDEEDIRTNSQLAQQQVRIFL